MTVPSRRAGAARPRRFRRWSSWRGVAPAIVVLALGLAACSGSATGSFAPVPTLNFLAPTQAPAPTHWPGSVIDAVIALGAADQDLGKAGNDLNAAVKSGDLQAVLQASSDTKTFLVGNQRSIPALQAYPALKPLGDKLATAYGQMIQGVTQIHDSLASGNAAGMTAGFQTFAAGGVAYADARSELGDAAQQAVLMKKLLLR